MPGIYCIHHKSRDRYYVGQTIQTFEARWGSHRSELRRNKHRSKYLQHCWNKYGEDDFEFILLEEVPFEQLNLREEYYINTLNSVFNSDMYVAGQRRLSDETRRKMSQVRKGRKQSQEWVERRVSGLRNKPLTEEHRKKLADAKLGTKRSDETKAKISKAHKGKSLSPEHKAKLSLAAKKREERKRNAR